MGENISAYTKEVSLQQNVLIVKLSSSVLRQELSYGKEKIVIMGNMMRKELDRHKELKENQQMIIDRIKNSYESSLLQG